jgi:hypothetical protein
MSKAIETLEAAQKRAMGGRPKVGGFPYIHSVSGRDGRGFVALLIMLVSRRYRVID